MTHASSPSRPPRSNSEYRWTDARALAFLEELARSGSVADAARAVGVSRNSAYRLRARAPVFAEGWEVAQRAATARLRQGIVAARSLQGDGPVTPRWRQGDAGSAK
ncbi:MAG TPA: hypothetical protein VNR60_09005 [Croceibacterium sp.]|nr:hypothetical protein [Croceibacterium sp.]